MAKTGRAYTGEVRTWISADDLVKFKEVARARGIKDTELAREMILAGLDALDAEQRDRLESVYAQQLKASTDEITNVIKAGVNRICALLAKVAVAALASNKFLARLEDTEDLMNECKGAAAKTIHADLTEGELRVAEGMRKKVGGA
ncbi:MAG: hypothetical protein KGS72_21510 [Cyanobacteria bacterium REEB67]|nr:hypothetical protein [Cyanobacteria bacterium REEB67]